MKLHQVSLLMVLILVAGCSEKHSSTVGSQQPISTSPKIENATKSAETPISYPEVHSLRAINFRNFDYEGLAVRNGKLGDWRDGLTLEKVSFGDVTGDGKEEAIANFRVDTEGSMGANRVFIFTLENSKPKVLLNWESGDRADGGLRAIYAKAGQLWVETYGVGTNLDNNDSSEFTGLCCPKHFTRTRYVWRDGKFQAVDKESVFPVSKS